MIYWCDQLKAETEALSWLQIGNASWFKTNWLICTGEIFKCRDGFSLAPLHNCGRGKHWVGEVDVPEPVLPPGARPDCPVDPPRRAAGGLRAPP